MTFYFYQSVNGMEKQWKSRAAFFLQGLFTEISSLCNVNRSSPK